MPDVNIPFAGQTLIVPGAYYIDQLSGFVPGLPTTPPLIFVGYGYGVKPNTPTTFVTGTALLAALRGGPASGYVQAIANPSPQLFGSQLVTFINAGENTQSSLVLKSGAGTNLATLTSVDYGSPSNLLQAQVQAGSLAGKQITVYDGYTGGTITGDNLGVPFQLAYTGAATGTISYTVTVSGLTATQFAVTSPNANESVSINLAGGQYDTVEKVVQYLNGTGFYSAVPLGDTSLPASYLDAAATITLPPVSGTVYQYVNITAALGAVIYWANQYAAGSYATAAASGSITGYTSGQAPANIPYTSFSGAVSVPPTNSDYAAALNIALTIPGWSVFIDSNVAAVRALGSQHVETASTPLYGKWRRFYTGSSPGESVATAIANAQALNSKRTIYVYPGLYQVDLNTNALVLRGGLFGAAAVAGMSAGNPPATPMTNKVLNGVGVETGLSITNINNLQQGGVMPILGTAPPASGQLNINRIPPTISSDMTTWQNDKNPENVFEQQIKCRDYLAYSMVNAAGPYVGTIADTNTELKILGAIQLTLNALIHTPGSNGVLAAWDPNALALNYTGNTQTAAVSSSVKLVGQNRFITETNTIFPLNLSINLPPTQAAA